MAAEEGVAVADTGETTAVLRWLVSLALEAYLCEDEEGVAVVSLEACLGV